MLGWVIALPGRAIAAPARLIGIGENLGSIEDSTRTLPDIESSLRSIASHTEVLEQVARDIAGVRAATDVLPGMDGRMAVIEGAMPALLDLRRDLERVPDTLERLDEGMAELSATLQLLLTALGELDENLGSIRLPRRRRPVA